MVLDDADSAPILAPTPQGKTYLLYLRESDLFGQEFEERSGTLRGKPVLVVSDVGRVAGQASDTFPDSGEIPTFWYSNRCVRLAY